MLWLGYQTEREKALCFAVKKRWWLYRQDDGGLTVLSGPWAAHPSESVEQSAYAEE